MVKSYMGLSAKKTLGMLVLSLFLAESSDAGIAVVGGLTYEKIAEAGETYEDVIMIRNPGPLPIEVKLYQTDYQFFHDGRNIYGEPGGLERSNAKWISFSPERLLIPPNSTAGVNYRVQVPVAAHLSGTYWSMIMAEEIPVGSREARDSRQREMQLGIGQVWRLGIQMVTQIGLTGTRDLEFINAELLPHDSKIILQVDVKNVGERWLKSSLWAELYDTRGKYIGRFEGNKMRIYPGTSVRFRIDLSQVPVGSYKALVAADCGGDDVFGANYELNLRE